METMTMALLRRQIEHLAESRADQGTDDRLAQELASARAIAETASLLLAEVVADVRAVRPGKHKVVSAAETSVGWVVTTEPRSAQDRSKSRWTWGAIGSVLGVTAQAAQQRFGAR